MSEPLNDYTTDGTCPWCGDWIEDLTDAVDRNNDVIELDCPSCARPIVGNVEVQCSLRPDLEYPAPEE